jgi:hypothetical protein
MDKRRVAKETFSKIGGAFAADLVPCQVEPRHSSVDLQNVSCGISQISASQLFICVSMRAEYRMCGLVGCCSKCSPSLRTGASLSPPPVKSSARTPCVSREASSANFWATCASRMGLIHLPCALNLSHQDGLASIRKTEGSADWRSDEQVTAARCNASGLKAESNLLRGLQGDAFLQILAVCSFFAEHNHAMLLDPNQHFDGQPFLSNEL